MTRRLIHEASPRPLARLPQRWGAVGPGSDDRLTAVTWGLFWAWAVHDAEELLTMPGWAERSRPRLERRLPWVPGRVWSRLSVDREHAATAIGLMGCLVATAAASGARTGGRSRLFQTVLAGFGAHAAPHVASAVLTRGYTPGLLTAPAVVAPYSWWAWRRLREAEVPITRASPGALVLLPVAILAAHAGAGRVLAARDRLSGRRVVAPAR